MWTAFKGLLWIVFFAALIFGVTKCNQYEAIHGPHNGDILSVQTVAGCKMYEVYQDSAYQDHVYTTVCAHSTSTDWDELHQSGKMSHTEKQHTEAHF
jgi:L-rhamnose mutarotase